MSSNIEKFVFVKQSESELAPLRCVGSTSSSTSIEAESQPMSPCAIYAVPNKAQSADAKIADATDDDRSTVVKTIFKEGAIRRKKLSAASMTEVILDSTKMTHVANKISFIPKEIFK